MFEDMLTGGGGGWLSVDGGGGGVEQAPLEVVLSNKEKPGNVSNITCGANKETNNPNALRHMSVTQRLIQQRFKNNSLFPKTSHGRSKVSAYP